VPQREASPGITERRLRPDAGEAEEGDGADRVARSVSGASARGGRG